MRVLDVRKKYPEFFVTIEESVWDDLKNCGAVINAAHRKRIAYNAAAIATLELHKIIINTKKNKK